MYRIASPATPGPEINPSRCAKWDKERQHTLGTGLNLTDVKTARTIQQLPSLSELGLYSPAVATDDVLAVLKSLQNLRDLNLYNGRDTENSRLTKAGLASLAEVKSLRILNLDGHPVEDQWLPPLYSLPLTWIKLHDTKVTPAGLLALQKAIPKCNIMPTPPK
jgi:hypothetical protein